LLPLPLPLSQPLLPLPLPLSQPLLRLLLQPLLQLS
jgi:hypothetical protein